MVGDRSCPWSSDAALESNGATVFPEEGEGVVVISFCNDDASLAMAIFRARELFPEPVELRNPFETVGDKISKSL